MKIKFFMKYVNSFDSFKKIKNEPINEEFIMGLFKNLKNKLSLGFSKQFGSAKEADAAIEAYKKEVTTAQEKKKAALKAYGQYIKSVKSGGEKDQNQIKTLTKNIELADKNYDQQIELIKQKFDIKFKEIIEDEENPKIQNYINLKKIEMQQELLNSETNSLLSDAGLKEEDVKDDPVFQKLLKEIQDKAKNAQKLADEQAKELSSKEEKETGFDIEQAKKMADKDEVYIWKESPLLKHTFEKGEKIKYFSKTNYLANKAGYTGTDAEVLEIELKDKSRMKVKTATGQPEINKGVVISSESYDRKQSEEAKQKTAGAEKTGEKGTEV
jgi:hypothetical protein